MPADSPHPKYAEWAPQWQMMRAVTAGEKAIKAATTQYLPMLGGMDERDYQDYLSAARFYPVTARTIQGLRGSAFRVPPVTQVPARMEPWLADIDLGGTPLDLFLMTDIEETLTVSRYGIRVDVREESPHPYFAAYTTENILNWQYGMVRGMKMLTMVVLRETEASFEKDEFVAEEETVLHVLDLPDGFCRFRVFRQNTETKKWIETLMPPPERRGELLDTVPFFMPELQKPPLLDVASVNLGHYMVTADYYDAIRFTCKPQPCTAGAGKMPKDEQARLRIGSRYAWMLPTGATSWYLETSGNGIGDARQALIDDEGRMARLGAAVIEEPKAGVESAETSRINQYGKLSLLSSIVTTTSLTVTKALQLMAWWGQMTETYDDPEISCTLNKNFVESTLSPPDLEALMRSWQGGAISRETLVYNTKRGGLLPENVTEEDELAQIDAGAPLPNVAPDNIVASQQTSPPQNETQNKQAEQEAA